MTIELTIVLPLITLLVGWLLSEASNRRREISSDRRAISRAIADLLEVRHRTYGLKAYLDEVTKKFKIPQQAQPIIFDILESILPNTDSLQKRYNDSVDTVASTNPLLGFRLRSKDELLKYLTALRQFASQDTNATQSYPHLEARLIDVIKSPMDESILELARTHSWLTWWKVKKYLRKPIFDQTELNELLSKFGPLISAAGQQTNNDACRGT